MVLFRCDWVNVNSRGLKRDKRGFTLVNFSHKIHEGGALKDDPYIFHLKHNKYSMLKMRKIRVGSML